ncbi:MAG: hypothetical protein U9Q34_06670, partial [Elusimicrobiota bacterium]|nr:hypothetical protein [Elusimicrobiota bacterium]
VSQSICKNKPQKCKLFQIVFWTKCMNLKKVLEILTKEFEKQKISYALIGGFAMGAYRMGRNTLDIDFLITIEDMKKVDTIMHGLSYKKIHATKDVSQYTSPVELFGEVDILHAQRPISKEMLKNSIIKDAFDEKLKVKVLLPEDIIGLKIQAIANNPARKAKDTLDIEDIISHFEGKMDWKKLSGYFKLFKMNTQYLSLKKKYEKKK